MKIDVIKNAVTSKVARQILITQKHSPKLLFAGGMVGMAGTVVLACRATLKLDEVLDGADKEHARIDQALEVGSERYSGKDAKRDRAIVVVRTAGDIAKLYAPAAALGVLSAGALTGSHVVLTRRNIALTAAYKAVETAYDEYQKRVVESVGEEKEREIRYSAETMAVLEETDKGPVVRDLKIPTNLGASKYARCFDQTNPKWQDTHMYNQFFIKCQEDYANDKLNAYGHLFLNDVYDSLGFPHTKEGAVVGWIKRPKDGGKDGHVDFGIFEGDGWSATRFVSGEEHSIWLDFNVDGVIFDKI